MLLISLLFDFTRRLEFTGADIFLSAAVALGRVRPLAQDGVFLATVVTLEQAGPNTHPLPIRNGFEFVSTETTLRPGVAVRDLGPPLVSAPIPCASITLKLAKSRFPRIPVPSWHHYGVYTTLTRGSVQFH